MKWTNVRGPALFALMAIGACSERTAEPTGVGLTIKVAPVTYPGLVNVSYDLGVYTGLYQLVWTEADVDAVTYGNSIGDITYIGPCDAQAQEDGWGPGCNDGDPTTLCGCTNPDEVTDCDAEGEKTGWIVLDINDIWTTFPGDPVPYSEWENPCEEFDFGPTDDPTTADCWLSYLCEENADVLVTFNITMMRDADQGFFDIIVNFEDLFCSAKFDTCYDDDPLTTVNEAGYIQLLFKDTDTPADGEGDTRWDTGVIGVACTGGPGADTNLYMDDIKIVCGTPPSQYTITLDPSQNPAGNVAAPTGQDIVFQYATYFGREELLCGLQENECGSETPVMCNPGLACLGNGCGECQTDTDCDGFGSCVITGNSDGTFGQCHESCKKKFWNIAIGFNTNNLSDHELNDNCTLHTSATASDGVFDDYWVTPATTKYPAIRFAINLTPGWNPPAGQDTTLACVNWGVDEVTDTHVYTDYTSLDCVKDDTSEFPDPDDCDFCHHMNGVNPEEPDDVTLENDRYECRAIPPPSMLTCDCRNGQGLIVPANICLTAQQPDCTGSPGQCKFLCGIQGMANVGDGECTNGCAGATGQLVRCDCFGAAPAGACVAAAECGSVPGSNADCNAVCGATGGVFTTCVGACDPN